jgi:hypothetical protein
MNLHRPIVDRGWMGGFEVVQSKSIFYGILTIPTATTSKIGTTVRSPVCHTLHSLVSPLRPVLSSLEASSSWLEFFRPPSSYLLQTDSVVI